MEEITYNSHNVDVAFTPTSVTIYIENTESVFKYGIHGESYEKRYRRLHTGVYNTDYDFLYKLM